MRTLQLLATHEQLGDEAFAQHFYDDAIHRFETAHKLAVLTSEADRSRLAQKLASVCFFCGDSKRVDRWMGQILGACLQNSQTHEKAASALVKLSQNCWLECRTKAALPFLAQALHFVTGRNSETRRRVKLIIASRLHELGHYEEAQTYVDSVGVLPRRTHWATLQLALPARAVCLAAIKNDKTAFELFDKALDLMEAHEPNGYNKIATLVDYGLWATALGEIDLAKKCFKIGLSAAIQHQIPWRIPHLALFYADVLHRAGQLELAKEYLCEAISAGSRVPRVRVMIPIVGIPISLQAADRKLLSSCADPRSLDIAFQSGESMLIGRAAASFAQYYGAEGRVNEARILLHKALGQVGSVDLALDLAVEIAQFGNDADVHRAHALLTERADRPHRHLAEAFLLLFDAIIIRRRRRAPESMAMSANAFSAFEKLGWFGYAEQARRLTGATAAVRMAASARALPVKSRASLLSALSPREQQVAELVCKGLTNRAVALELSITENTVESHMSSIMNRYGIFSRHQLVDLLSQAASQ